MGTRLQRAGRAAGRMTVVVSSAVSAFGRTRMLTWMHRRGNASRDLSETFMRQGLKAQRLLALFFTGLALFNFPLLALWDVDAQVWGLPLFPLALFVLWSLLIAALAWIMESDAPSDTSGG